MAETSPASPTPRPPLAGGPDLRRRDPTPTPTPGSRARTATGPAAHLAPFLGACLVRLESRPTLAHEPAGRPGRLVAETGLRRECPGPESDRGRSVRPGQPAPLFLPSAFPRRFRGGGGLDPGSGGRSRLRRSPGSLLAPSPGFRRRPEHRPGRPGRPLRVLLPSAFPWRFRGCVGLDLAERRTIGPPSVAGILLRPEPRAAGSRRRPGRHRGRPPALLRVVAAASPPDSELVAETDSDSIPGLRVHRYRRLTRVVPSSPPPAAAPASSSRPAHAGAGRIVADRHPGSAVRATKKSPGARGPGARERVRPKWSGRSGQATFGRCGAGFLLSWTGR